MGRRAGEIPGGRFFRGRRAMGMGIEWVVAAVLAAMFATWCLSAWWWWP